MKIPAHDWQPHPYRVQSRVKQSSFREKQNIPGGFRDSPLCLNESLAASGAMG